MSLRDLETPAEREVRRLVTLAHERELGKHLERLEADFGAWRGGSINAIALAERIRAFSEGPARAVARKYVPNNTMTALGHAVVVGVVAESEVPGELREELAVVVSVLKFKR
jgi:hypothetical protein